MAHIFWDMDHTIIANDCDVSWKQFLVAEGLAPAETLADVDRFFEQYVRAELDVEAFWAFQLREFVGRTPEDMEPLLQKHFDIVVRPRIYPAAAALIRQQEAAGHTRCLLTATNACIAGPLARHFGFDHVIASMLELADGRYTGRLTGTYTYGHGKCRALEEFCAEHGIDPANASYYGDSKSDIPVLRRVGHPYAVNPNAALRSEAESHGWPILEFTLDE